MLSGVREDPIVAALLPGLHHPPLLLHGPAPVDGRHPGLCLCQFGAFAGGGHRGCEMLLQPFAGNCLICRVEMGLHHLEWQMRKTISSVAHNQLRTMVK